jgi:ElaB/YqjD/DUF883 family membrane-anchored ribosome-binding protein
MASTTSAKRQATSSVKRAKDDLAAGAEEIVGEAKAAARSAKSAAKSTAKTTAKRIRSEADTIEASLQRGAEDLAASVGEKLRAAGLDTDRMVDVAKEQASELQRLIEDEIRERPLRALGLAAAVGLFVGFLSAR